MDTSAWIRSGRGTEPYYSVGRGMTARMQVLGHPLVYGELLIGDRGGRRVLLEAYRKFQWAELVANEDVVAMVNARRLQGRGIGWINAHLLASALLGHYRLWTADEPLAAVARDLGVGWSPG